MIAILTFMCFYDFLDIVMKINDDGKHDKKLKLSLIFGIFEISQTKLGYYITEC